MGFDDSEGWFTLVLEDIAPARQGDQIAGCSARAGAGGDGELAELHAPVLGDPELAEADWLNLPSPLNQALLTQLLPGFLERYDGASRPSTGCCASTSFASADGWLAEQPAALGLAHGDYRLDNMLFGRGGRAAPAHRRGLADGLVGPADVDAAYFLGISLEADERRAHEEELLRAYLERSARRACRWDECWARVPADRRSTPC